MASRKNAAVHPLVDVPVAMAWRSRIGVIVENGMRGGGDQEQLMNSEMEKWKRQDFVCTLFFNSCGIWVTDTCHRF